MSFDLGVWHSEVPLTDAQAADIYVHLCENWPYLEGGSSSIATFYCELTGRWPEIDTVPEEKIDDTEYCPWSCALAHSGMAVVMSCVWSMADNVAVFVRDLAKKRGLVLFDPQTGEVTLPEHLRR
jgi:hypothetical protein